MHKISLFVLAAVSLLAVQSAEGKVLSPKEALDRALEKEASSKLRAPSMNKQMQPALIVEASGEAACYVFGQNQGYVIVSADDMVAPILGYADEGSFDAGSMPPSMRYWLDSYASQIEWLRNNAQPKAKVTAQRPERAAIAPLVKTRWNQDAPFNDMCPLDNGKRSVTGCVATALAQIMNYHQWPDKGTGTKSYTWNGQTLSLDYSTITYDWADMLDVYTSSATEAQKDAVATLMYSCGVAVEMDYSSDESGASSYKVANAMIEHFGYDKGIEYIPRSCYGLYEWEDLIYDQLKNYGPVQYSGQSNDGGHSFVCDGYSTDGYFHINWGWGGMSDGYFLLTALDPGTQGIGGSTSGYNFAQDIIANVQKPTGSDTYSYIMVMATDFSIVQSSAKLGAAFTVSGDVYNYSTTKLTGFLGVKFTSVETGKSYYGGNTKLSELQQLGGYSRYSAHAPEDMPEGSYVVTPAFQIDDKWYDVRTTVSKVRSVTATVSGDTVTFTPGQAASLKIEDIEPQSSFYLGSKYSINATAVNTSETDEYYGPVRAAFIDSSNNLIAVGDEYPLDIMGGESEEMVYLSGWSYLGSTAPTAGTYSLGFVDSGSISSASQYTLVSDLTPVTVNAAATSTSISVTDVHMTDGNSASVDKSDLSISATVTCESGYFADKLSLAIFPYTSGTVSSLAVFSTDDVFLSEGQSAEVTAHGNFAAGEDGKKYFAAFYSGQSQVSPEIIFTLAVTTGLDEDIAYNSVRTFEIFTTGGVKVRESRGFGIDKTGLAPGMYITRSKDDRGSVVVEKIVIFAQ